MRHLEFSDIDQIVIEIDRLHHNGSRATGKWNLAQICDHLNYFIAGSLDGYTFKVPWIIRVLFAKPALRHILTTKKMKTGAPTPQKPLPSADTNEAVAVARLKATLERWKAHTGPLHPSPFFGPLTGEQYRILHLTHCAHHLAHLE